MGSVSDRQVEEVHGAAVVVDQTCPLLGFRPSSYAMWKQGGATVAAATVAATHTCREAIERLAKWHAYMDAHAADLLLVTRPEHMEQAKAEGRLGVIFQFQNSLPVERDLSLLTLYHRLGVRMIQITYNQKNFVGDGCEERTDAGLSHFGIQMIREMNRLGIIVDVSHTGVRTTLEAIEMSETPAIFSHSNVRNVHDSMRNLTDEQIRAVARAGGVIGVVGFPAFVSRSARPTIADLIRHVRYIVDLVGVDHLGVGLDYFDKMAGVCSDEEARAFYDAVMADGRWSPESYPPPPWYYPQEIATPALLQNFTRALLQDGFSADEVVKIMGGNFLRVCRAVWTE